MDSLKTKATPKAMTRALETLPATLDDIYEDNTKRIEAQPEDDAIIAKKILSWVVWSNSMRLKGATSRPLAVRPEDDDLDIDELLDEDVLFQVTAGLTITDYEGSIRLFHCTAQNYFEKNKERWFTQAQVEIAMATLTYLNLQSFAEP